MFYSYYSKENNEAELTKREVISRKIIIVMHTTYFGRNLDVMVFRMPKISTF
jgi:hypothetical protein